MTLSAINKVANPNDGQWRIVTTESEFNRLRNEWERLYRQNPMHSPFLAWGWVSAWLKYLAGPHELRTIVWNDDEGLAQFIVPFIAVKKSGMFARRSIMLACGYGREASDYLGCLRLPRHDDRMADLVAHAINKFFGENMHVNLTSLDNRTGFVSNLEARMKGLGRLTRCQAQDVCVSVELPGGWDEYLLQLSTNHRSQVRRRYRNVEKDSGVRICSIDARGAKKFTEDLVRLNRQRISQLGRASSLEDDRIRDFLMEAIPYMAANNLAWMDTLEKDGNTIAVALNFVHGRTVFYYLGGFESSATRMSPGTVLFAHAIRRCIVGKYLVYDFLRGQEDYKYRWGAADSPMYKLDIYPRGLLSGRTALAIDALKSSLKRAIRLLPRRR